MSDMGRAKAGTQLRVWQACRALAVTAAFLLFGTAPSTSSAQQPAVSGDTIAGIWQFETPLCGSSYGMGLFKDGTTWLDEPFSGTWQLDGTTLRFDLDEYDPGQDKPLATGIIVEAEILTFSGDALRLRWLSTGLEIDAFRCPDP